MRKRSNLSMNRTKKWRKSKKKQSTYTYTNTMKPPTPRSFPKFPQYMYDVRKHTCTPLKRRTPKRRRFLTPRQTPNSEKKKQEILSPKPECNASNCESLSCNFEEELSEIDVQKAVKKMKNHGIASDFLSFIRLVNDGKFPLDNISLLLFLETVRFMSTNSTSEMWYWDTTKRFWKTGYRLFHGKFLYYMGGPKNTGQVMEGISQPGLSNSDNSQVNFAVPSVSTIADYNSMDSHVPKLIKPGVLEPVLASLKNQSAQEFMLCADGKKVTAGIDTTGGDVDMFSFEDGITFNERKQHLEFQISSLESVNHYINQIIQTESTAVFEKTEISQKLQSAVDVLGERMRECRELAIRQKMGLLKFKNMAGENWRDSKYVFVISGLQASLFQLRELVQNCLTTTGAILKYTSSVLETSHNYAVENVVDMSYQRNTVTLKDPNDEFMEIEPRFLKQRSPIWHILRRKARVTGSTLHSALGLRGLKEQKIHFAKFIDDVNVNESEDTQIRMEHGSINEINAVATLVGRVMPVYFPECQFFEEGCYVISGEVVDVLGVVSPDGSIRLQAQDAPDGEAKIVSAVEIKCPYPNERKVTVHYSLPEYYVCQILAEMYALKTDTLIYVTYSSESSVFLRVAFDKDLWDMIWLHAKTLYDMSVPKKQTRTSAQTKAIKNELKKFVKKNVKFICEVPSCTMIDSGLRELSNDSYFSYALERTPENEREESHCFEEISNSIEKSKGLVKSVYEVLRKRATEVMVWVLTNKDRNSSTETPCSVPIAYGLKDYRLTSNAMRNATDFVLKMCSEAGLKILNLAADGQWIQLMSRDSDGNPLTIYQLQKDVWNSTKSLSKQDLLKAFSDLLDGEPNRHIVKEKTSRGIILGTEDDILASVRTPDDPLLWNRRSKENTDVEIDADPTGERGESQQSDWLPNIVRTQICETDDQDLHTAVSRVSSEIGQLMDGNNDSSPMNIDLEDSVQSENCAGSGSSIMATPEEVIIITDDVRKRILYSLQNNELTASKWSNLTDTQLVEIMSSAENLQTFRHSDLDVLYDEIKTELPGSYAVMKKSAKKEEKLSYLSRVLGIPYVCPAVESSGRNIKRKNPLSLKRTASKTIQSKTYPKAVLRVAYATYLFRNKLRGWQNDAPFKGPMLIDGTNTTVQYWFSQPERSAATGSLLTKSIDCSHNLTHLRVRTSTTGICGISSEAWRACARSNETKLSAPLVEDLIDKQSVANARTHFSEPVEIWMREHGFPRAAQLTMLVRNWYNASDNPAIPATLRLKHLLEMRAFLLDKVDFTKFPPVTRYFKGIPCVTYEGMMIDIDSKIQLHGLTEGYNIRAVGSLAAETTVGLLQSLSPTSQVSIKARDLPSLVSSVVEIMTCKSNANRGFWMRTSKLSGVYPDRCEADCSKEDVDHVPGNAVPSSIIVPRDHQFDQPNRRSRRKIKFGSISGPYAPSRGALPVRQYHRKDESKILPTKRLGIDLHE